MTDIIITLPSKILWADYERELEQAKAGATLHFKVSRFPTDTKVGDRCYLVHNGYVHGWMAITGFSEKSFTCEVTGKEWNGRFIERSGPFHFIIPGFPMKGFQGWRYLREPMPVSE